MARPKRNKEAALKHLIYLLPKWILIMVLCLGVCFAVLVETGIISTDSIVKLFDKPLFDSRIDADIPEEARDFCVYTLDVGQGDCIFIYADGKSILIDSGEKDYYSEVISFISKKGVKKLDYIIATHPHSDHIGGMSMIIDEFGADKIIVPKLPDEMVPASKCYESFLASVKRKGSKLTAAKAGNTYNVAQINDKEVTLTIVSPSEKSVFEDLNDYSVTVRLDYGNISWLFTGDLSKPGETALLENGMDIDVTALKVGHHGSTHSSSNEFLKAVTPKLCVISCGKDNSYGHPHDKALKRLSAFTDTILRTDELGTIAVYSDGEKLYASN